MASSKTRSQSASRKPGRTAAEKASGKTARAEPPRISGLWLLAAMGITIAAAAVCGWGVLCLLFWQGSWQLLYHPASAIIRTPASAGLAFDSIGFAATDDGVPQLKGWWVPAASGAKFSRYTVLYLDGQDGNIGDAVDAISRLHATGVNVFAFDYRGYGQSRFARPSEAHWRQDAGWALDYLMSTRHIRAKSIVLDGEALGANLALEVAAAHPELAGVVVDSPDEAPMEAIFSDARARMVPAHMLVRDRYALSEPAAALHVPALWFEKIRTPGLGGGPADPDAFTRIGSHKMLVWLDPSQDVNKQYADALSRWIDGLD